jgi:hypothetical protein
MSHLRKMKLFCDNATFFEHTSMLNILSGKRSWSNIFGLVQQPGFVVWPQLRNWGVVTSFHWFFFWPPAEKISRQEKKTCSLPTDRRNKRDPWYAVQLAIQKLKPKIFFESIADIRKIMVLFTVIIWRKEKGTSPR